MCFPPVGMLPAPDNQEPFESSGKSFQTAFLDNVIKLLVSMSTKLFVLKRFPMTSHVFKFGDFMSYLESQHRDFPGGLVVKNLPSNAGDAGSIPGRGTKIPHAVGQLNLRATTTDPTCLN